VYEDFALALGGARGKLSYRPLGDVNSFTGSGFDADAHVFHNRSIVAAVARHARNEVEAGSKSPEKG
jgi:hypothetical protein